MIQQHWPCTLHSWYFQNTAALTRCLSTACLKTHATVEAIGAMLTAHGSAPLLMPWVCRLWLAGCTVLLLLADPLHQTASIVTCPPNLGALQAKLRRRNTIPLTQLFQKAMCAL